MSYATVDPDQRTTDAHTDLAAVLERGGWLRPIEVPDLVLPDGEHAYADFWATGWRYEAAVVPYERRTVVVGGPFMALATWATSGVGNRRRRAQAEAASAPQWRPLGHIRVVVTFSRLLVLHGGAWWSVWYSEVVGACTDANGQYLDVTFRADPPYRFAFRGASDLASVLTFNLCPAGHSTSLDGGITPSGGVAW